MPGGPRRHLTAGRRGCGGRPGGTTGSGPEAEEARRTRYLRLDWDQERSVLWLEGMLPAEEGTALQAALHARAESIPPDPGAADPPGPGWPTPWWTWPPGSRSRPPWWSTPKRGCWPAPSRRPVRGWPRPTGAGAFPRR